MILCTFAAVIDFVYICRRYHFDSKAAQKVPTKAAFHRHLPEPEVVVPRPQVLLTAMSSHSLPEGADENGISSSPCLILKKVDSQPDKKMYYLHTESQEKYFEDVIRLHKSGCSSRKIAKLLPVEKTTVSNWISIFVREKGQVMRIRTVPGRRRCRRRMRWKLCAVV